MATGISDVGTIVYLRGTGSYSQLVPVSKIGAVGGSMDKHESTCLDDSVKTYEEGRKDTNEIEFTYNFNSANAVAVKAAMDGVTQQTLFIMYGDLSGYEVTGVGTDTTSDASTNSLLTATFTLVVSAEPTWYPIATAAARVAAPYATTVATPTADPVAGAVADNSSVALACGTSGAAIYYTVDGTTPTKASTLYSAPIVITDPVTIKAIGTKTGMNNSAVLSAAYTIS